MNAEQDTFWAWLAGFIDGDGCFSFPINLRTKKDNKPWINITVQLRIALKGNDGFILEKIQQVTNRGKIYYSNKGKENCICSWQTTNWADALYLSEKLLPHIQLKKKKCQIFYDLCKEYIEQMHPAGTGNRHQGYLRTKEFLLRFVKVSTEINADRQTKRYRNVKNYEFWKKVINELYKMEATPNGK